MAVRPESVADADAAAAAAVELTPEGAQAARELARAVRAVAASLPFGADPADYLAALERLAGEQEEVALPLP